jgi:putative SOS response-associated peptidase YedK
MCSRHTRYRTRAAYQVSYPTVNFASIPEHRWRTSYNVAPTASVLVVANDGDGSAEWMRWGLIPSWAKDDKLGRSMVNARAETVAEKPAFRAAWKRRRCVVFGDGFIEWQTVGKDKLPLLFEHSLGIPFAFAGLWEVWAPEGQEPVRSCTILTTEPNAFLSQIHDRMPVLLGPEQVTSWLNSTADLQAARAMCRPAPSSWLKATPISTVVNSVKNHGEECLALRNDGPGYNVGQLAEFQAQAVEEELARAPSPPRSSSANEPPATPTANDHPGGEGAKAGS